MAIVTGRPKQQLVKDFNFFKKISVTSATFLDFSDVFIPFTTNGIMIINEGSGATNVIEYSLDGITVHGELAADSTVTKTLTFNNRVISALFFRIKSGSSGTITVSVHAWA